MPVYQGDCLSVMKGMADNSVDAVVTDPPYGLSFMNKGWDYDVPDVNTWREALRVLKPGGHLLSFGGTRTYHRLVVAIEDAGFEIRDQIQWLYGSGFPKSMDISKAIDKQAGVEREVVGIDESKLRPNRNKFLLADQPGGGGKLGSDNGATVTAPATESAKQWQGWGTALKPANEPICLARKPISEKTVAANVIKWGTGGINVDASRIQTNGEKLNSHGNKGDSFSQSYKEKGTRPQAMPPNSGHAQGRWPANLLLDETAAEMLDEQSGTTGPTGRKAKKHSEQIGMYGGGDKTNNDYSDSGGASRFFYVAKTSKRERGEENNHPTVKPIKLMEYLIRLITPPNGTVLDPFMGSGSTGVAAKNLGFLFIGIEMSAEYVEIAERRINAAI